MRGTIGGRATSSAAVVPIALISSSPISGRIPFFNERSIASLNDFRCDNAVTLLRSLHVPHCLRNRLPDGLPRHTFSPTASAPAPRASTRCRSRFARE